MSKRTISIRLVLRHTLVGFVAVVASLAVGAAAMASNDEDSCEDGTCTPSVSTYSCLHDDHVHEGYECVDPETDECTTCLPQHEDICFHPGGAELMDHVDSEDIEN